MKKGTKIALIVAVACLVVGLPLFAVPAARLAAQPLSPVTDLRQEGERLDPSATTDGQTEEAPNNSGLTAHVWQPERSFTGIRVEVVNPHVTVLPAEDGITRVEYTQDSRYPITLQQEGDTLRVTQKDYWTMGLLDLLTRPQIRIYLAEQTYNALSVDVTSGSVEVAAGLTFGTISLETTSGSITCHADARGELELDSTSGSVAVENITAASLSAETTSGSITITATTVERELELDSTSGKITVNGVTCGSAELENGSGKLQLTDLLCRGSLEAETTSGGIHLERCDAANLSLSTVSGTVRGSLLSPKQFRTDTASGGVDVPDSAGTGICRIETVSGGIHITIETAP